MATVIYMRVSTDGQIHDGQEHGLIAKFPGAEIIKETASGGKSRPILEALVKRLSAGDTLAVASLDRLGRVTSQILCLIEDLQRKGVNVISLREGVDYSSPTGRLVTQIMVSVSELEKSLIGTRTKAALQAKKAKGERLGPPPTYSQNDFTKAKSMRLEGYSYREIGKATGMSLGKLSTLFKNL